METNGCPASPFRGVVGYSYRFGVVVSALSAAIAHLVRAGLVGWKKSFRMFHSAPLTLSPFCDAWIRAGADARIPICPARLTSQAFCLGSFSFVLTLCVRTGLGPSGTMPGRIGGPTARPVLCDQSAYGTPSNVGNKILATGSGILLPCARTESVSVL